MYSILIIDDEPIVKIALRSILPWEEHGFSICGTASNGLEAMSLIEKHQPDVIITDLKMPATCPGYSRRAASAPIPSSGSSTIL